MDVLELRIDDNREYVDIYVNGRNFADMVCESERKAGVEDHNGYERLSITDLVPEFGVSFGNDDMPFYRDVLWSVDNDGVSFSMQIIEDCGEVYWREYDNYEINCDYDIPEFTFDADQYNREFDKVRDVKEQNDREYMDWLMSQIEQAINDTLPGTSLFVRDCNLKKSQMKQYRVGQILRNEFFLDATPRVMGMKTTHRFTIISNHMTDFSQFEHGTNWELCVANRNTYFKVLDIYEYDGKTQILLLHLPDDGRWRLFQKTVIEGVIDNLVKDCRRRFENKCNEEVLPELATDEWMERCSQPIGIRLGTKYPRASDLEIPVEYLLRPVSKYSFRDFYHKLVYITCPELTNKFVTIDSNWKEYTGVIAYGYIDEEAGLSFRVIAPANHDEKKVYRGEIIRDIMQVIRSGSVKEEQYLYLQRTAMDLYPFRKLVEEVNEDYDTRNQKKAEMREMTFLDPLRSSEYPDDVQVILAKDGLNPEMVWVRCEDYDDEVLKGILLNDPYSDFGIRSGEIINFRPYETDDGLCCIAKFNKR